MQRVVKCAARVRAEAVRVVLFTPRASRRHATQHFTMPCLRAPRRRFTEIDFQYDLMPCGAPRVFFLLRVTLDTRSCAMPVDD